MSVRYVWRAMTWDTREDAKYMTSTYVEKRESMKREQKYHLKKDRLVSCFPSNIPYLLYCSRTNLFQFLATAE